MCFLISSSKVKSRTLTFTAGCHHESLFDPSVSLSFCSLSWLRRSRLRPWRRPLVRSKKSFWDRTTFILSLCSPFCGLTEVSSWIQVRYIDLAFCQRVWYHSSVRTKYIFTVLIMRKDLNFDMWGDKYTQGILTHSAASHAKYKLMLSLSLRLKCSEEKMEYNNR